jgi:hypothetical protein
VLIYVLVAKKTTAGACQIMMPRPIESPSYLMGRDESGVDNFRIRSDPNPNYADMEKSF